MKLQRLSGRKRCEYVLKKGRTWKGTHMRVSYIKGPPRYPDSTISEEGVYMGITTSRKLDKSAVKRNRMRRRVREAFRLYLKDRKAPSIQLIAQPKSSSLECDFAEIASDASAFFSSL